MSGDDVVNIPLRFDIYGSDTRIEVGESWILEHFADQETALKAAELVRWAVVRYGEIIERATGGVFRQELKGRP